MSLFFHSSNSLQTLANLFFRDLAQGSRPPLAQHKVVVQTSGMGRWLSLRLADQAAICAGLEFFFPNRIINDFFNAVLPKQAATPDQEAMAWQIMALLPALCGEDEIFTPVRHYLEDDEQGLKLFQLAGRLADLFDQYQIYRPDMILAWQQGNDWFSQPSYDGVGDQAWQQRLWLALQLPTNRAVIWRDFLQLVEQDAVPAGAGLPYAIAIFGVSVMPPFHLKVFQAAAQLMDVHFYQLTPCREYWGFIKTRREMRRAEKFSGRHAEELFMDDVNPLLASQGVLGRDFLNLVLEMECGYEQEELFVERDAGSHLQLLQADLLNLTEPQQADEVWQESDRSLAIHSCHSPLREVEVLHDQLLWYMKEYKLTPADILVMSPELPTYAPLLRAVFAGEGLIPFTIADLPTTTLQTMMDGFFALLHLLSSRYQATELIGLLEQEAVAQCFNLTPADVEQIRAWLPESGICWGMDEDMVTDLHGPGQVSWQAGEERLLLGYAMAAQPDQDVAGVFPFMDFNEDEAPVLGGLLDFLAALRGFRATISESRSVEQWQQLLKKLLGRFFTIEGWHEQAWLAINELISAPVGDGSQYQQVDLAVIQSWLQQRYNAALHVRGFMGGGVTCCAMLPMRSIPFKLICLVGMNDGAFPRLDQRLEYDLTQVENRPGDRSSKDNDRYLFLETLISAQEFLYLSYCGQSIADNASLPSSVLVAELVDYLRVRFDLDEDEGKKLVVRHRLQGFHADYFVGGAGLPSFSVENCQAAQAGVAVKEITPPFFTQPLAASPITRVALADLVSFFSHPMRYLYKRVLGISLESRTALLADHEPFALDGLQSYQLRDFLLQAEGQDALMRRFDVASGKGRLPDGNPGRWLTGKMHTELAEFLSWISPLQQEAIASCDVEIELDGISLHGRLDHLYAGQQLLYRPVRLEAHFKKGRLQVGRRKELIRAWIYHLALCHTTEQPQTTVLTGLDCTAVRFMPVAEPGKVLATLLQNFQQGLAAPVPFYPKYSLGLVEGESLEGLAKAWDKDNYEGVGDIYYCHGLAASPFTDARFGDMAEEIGGALYEHIELFDFDLG